MSTPPIENERRRKNLSDLLGEQLRKRNPICTYAGWRNGSDDSRSDTDLACGINLEEESEKNVILSPEDFDCIDILEEVEKKNFKMMDCVCPQCGIMMNSRNLDYMHMGSQMIHMIVGMNKVVDYVLDEDLNFFVKHLKQFKEFIEQRVVILEQKRDALKSALKAHIDILTNREAYYDNDIKLIRNLSIEINKIINNCKFKTNDAIIAVEELYSKIGIAPEIPEPRLPFTKTLVNNLWYFLEYIKNEKDKIKSISQIFKQRLSKLFDCKNIFKLDYQEICDDAEIGSSSSYSDISSTCSNPKVKKNITILKVENNLKNMEQQISNLKTQIKYIKESKKLNLNDSEDVRILKAFAFLILKYSSQLNGIDQEQECTDSEYNYQMFYGSRYLENVELAMIFGGYKTESDNKEGKSDHIPIRMSMPFSSGINIAVQDSGTIGGSADGYVAIFNNYRVKTLYITNLLTGDSVIVLNNSCWVQPIFWGKKLLFFTTWDDNMLMFDREEFMRTPKLSLGTKISKEKLLNLPESFRTQHTGLLTFSTIGGAIKVFDVEKEDIVDEIQVGKSLSPVPVFGIERLARSTTTITTTNKKEVITEGDTKSDLKTFKELNLMYMSTPQGLLKRDESGEYKEIIKTEGTVSSIILSEKHPEDPSKALVFCWGKVYYGDKSSRRLCNIPIKPINMIMRLYSNVYYIIDSRNHRWECRRIFFEDEMDHRGII